MPVARCTCDTSYEEIDAYIEWQMNRLNIPGASLAIVEGDKIVHLRGFGKARPWRTMAFWKQGNGYYRYLWWGRTQPDSSEESTSHPRIGS